MTMMMLLETREGPCRPVIGGSSRAQSTIQSLQLGSTSSVGRRAMRMDKFRRGLSEGLSEVLSLFVVVNFYINFRQGWAEASEIFFYNFYKHEKVHFSCCEIDKKCVFHQNSAFASCVRYFDRACYGLCARLEDTTGR